MFWPSKGAASNICLVAIVNLFIQVFYFNTHNVHFLPRKFGSQTYFRPVRVIHFFKSKVYYVIFHFLPLLFCNYFKQVSVLWLALSINLYLVSPLFLINSLANSPTTHFYLFFIYFYCIYKFLSFTSFPNFYRFITSLVSLTFFRLSSYKQTNGHFELIC